MKLPSKLISKLKSRENSNSLRQLESSTDGIDFFSNDYLGLAKSTLIFDEAHSLTSRINDLKNGATGSRLISGNHNVHVELESYLATIHQTESALLYNSGYDANIGFFSAVPQRNDVVFYDKQIHASIRDGICLSNAKSISFKHNDLIDLEKKLNRTTQVEEIYIVTESVFSMDGDTPNLVELIKLANQYNCKLIVDEAHALGVFGLGITQEANLENAFFARIVTFGKGLGCHGAVILCKNDLKSYLINFSRSFIYTTALPIHAIATIKSAYTTLLSSTTENDLLKENIIFFKSYCKTLHINHYFTNSDSAIQSCIVNETNKVKQVATKIINAGFNVKAILHPTVPINEERIRFCIHSFNTKVEIKQLLVTLRHCLIE